MNDQQESVLVVDDDESFLTLMTRVLENYGYPVLSASDSLKALDILRNSPPPAVLLTDLMMPKMSGLDLLRRAREMDPYLEIIVITAAGSIESAIASMRDNRAYDYLLKPLKSINQLPIVVGRAAAHRRLILEREALEKQIETDAQQLQALITTVSEGIIAIAPDGTISMANPAAARLLARENLVGQYVSSVLPAKLVSLLENWQAIGSGRPASMEIHWRDQSIQLVSLTPLLGQGNEWKGSVMVLRDITTLKRLDQLKNQTLLETISKIRKPMAEAMNAVVDLNLRAAQDERLAGSLFRLTNVWERIQTWGDELLSIVQAESAWDIRPKQVDLNKILEDIQNDRGISSYKQNGVKLNIHIASRLPVVGTNPEMLARLLHDLIRRAKNRSPRDGEICIRAREQKGQVWIEIHDDGPEAAEPDLMQAFDNDLSASITGSPEVGLNLMRVKSMLAKLDGQLWIGDQKPTGSTLIICLPIFTASTNKEAR